VLITPRFSNFYFLGLLTPPAQLLSLLFTSEAAVTSSPVPDNLLIEVPRINVKWFVRGSLFFPLLNC